MAQPIQPPTQTQPDTTTAPLSTRAQKLQEQILELQLAQLQKTSAEDAETDRISKEARKQGANAMQIRRNQEMQTQEQCPHLKPNMQTAVCGQRTHSQNLTLICQYCAAEFNEKTIPRHLIPAGNLVGGPQMGSVI